jgi:hypothetical protein
VKIISLVIIKKQKALVSEDFLQGSTLFKADVTDDIPLNNNKPGENIRNGGSNFYSNPSQWGILILE